MARLGEPFPDWDWADLRYCQYCDEVRGATAMGFDAVQRYICSVCLREEARVNV